MNKDGMFTIYVPVGDRKLIDEFRMLCACRHVHVNTVILALITQYLREQKSESQGNKESGV